MPLFAFKKQTDNNPYSPTYKEERWVRDPFHDDNCEDLELPNWEVISRGCSVSETSYEPYITI